MDIENRPRAPERVIVPSIELPPVLAAEFARGTLEQNKPYLMGSEDKETHERTREWLCYTDSTSLPNGELVMFNIVYEKHDEPATDKHFINVRFEYKGNEPTAEGKRGNISEMSWERGLSGNPYPYDLQQVHRYTATSHRGTGTSTQLYNQSEAWAQQLANVEGRDLVLGLSTDQPDTMTWAMSLGYELYSEERERYDEFVAHPERFKPVDSMIDGANQERGIALDDSNGKPFRVWFRKVLSPEQK